MNRLFVVALACALPACIEDNPIQGDLIAPLDEAAFRCRVEPMLARDCSYTGCHGQAAMPLRVYAVGKLRQTTVTTTDERTAPITDDERHANFTSALGFTYGRPAAADNLLVRKALPAEDGGYGHRGGAIFTGPDDPRAAALSAWLDGATGCGDLPP